jgi:CheY-like chemotaxis protein
MLRPSLPSTIDIVQEIDSAVGSILADPAQLNQVLMNLCTNAFHAMEKSGGTLTITLKERHRNKNNLPPLSYLAEGAYVQLLVKDTGFGIPSEDKSRVFEPYFTTKAVNKGSGMGLSIVHGIIRRFKGYIQIESEIGKGTAVYVCFPVSNMQNYDEENEVQELPTGKENILFIDDEEALANWGKSALQRLGYHVIVSNDSLEALKIFTDQQDFFDIVITDQTMPKLTGYDLAKQILKINSDIPIILCTGYSSILSEEKALSLGIKAFLYKPFRKHQIAKLVRNVLDNSPKRPSSSQGNSNMSE